VSRIGMRITLPRMITRISAARSAYVFFRKDIKTLPLGKTQITPLKVLVGNRRF